MGLFELFFKVLSLYLEARIRIRNRIQVKGRIWIRDPDPHENDKQDPDPDLHQSDKQDPDPHRSGADPQHCVQ